MINKRIGRKSQNMVEIVFVIPLMLGMLLGILEYALFVRNVNAVQDIAVEASVAASKYFVPADAPQGNPFSENIAVNRAIKVLEKRIGSIGVTGLTFTYNDLGPAFGRRPFALYEFESDQEVLYKDAKAPIIRFTVDYRAPDTDGVSVQLVYHYNLVLFHLELKLPTGRKLTLIPGVIQISSTQTKQYVEY